MEIHLQIWTNHKKQFPALHSYTIEAYKSNPLSQYHICNLNFEYTYLTRASQLDILKLWFFLIVLQLQAASLYTTLMLEMLYDEQWCSKTALTGIPSSGVSVGCTPLARTTASHSGKQMVDLGWVTGLVRLCKNGDWRTSTGLPPSSRLDSKRCVAVQQTGL